MEQFIRNRWLSGCCEPSSHCCGLGDFVIILQWSTELWFVTTLKCFIARTAKKTILQRRYLFPLHTAYHQLWCVAELAETVLNIAGHLKEPYYRGLLSNTGCQYALVQVILKCPVVYEMTQNLTEIKVILGLHITLHISTTFSHSQ